MPRTSISCLKWSFFSCISSRVFSLMKVLLGISFLIWLLLTFSSWSSLRVLLIMPKATTACLPSMDRTLPAEVCPLSRTRSPSRIVSLSNPFGFSSFARLFLRSLRALILAISRASFSFSSWVAEIPVLNSWSDCRASLVCSLSACASRISRIVFSILALLSVKRRSASFLASWIISFRCWLIAASSFS